jgi:hypothetical protein
MLHAFNRRNLLSILAMSCVVGLAVLAPQVHAANLRIMMVDGTSLEVPFCWEEEGQIRFEMPGGTAGIPKSNVASIQEIVTAGEFSPDVIAKSTSAARATEKNKALVAIVDKQTTAKQGYRALSPEEAAQLMETRSREGLPTDSAKGIRIHTTTISPQADLSDLAQAQGNGPAAIMLVKQIMSTRENVHSKRFNLNLYDAQGNIIERKPCELSELTVDKKTLRQLGISGSLFAVTATVRMDPKIKRYEITSAQ